MAYPYYAAYEDAFVEAQARAEEQPNAGARSDWGLEKWNSPLCPGMTFRIFRLPPPKYRSGFEVRCQVVEPMVMTTAEFRARGYDVEEAS